MQNLCNTPAKPSIIQSIREHDQQSFNPIPNMQSITDALLKHHSILADQFHPQKITMLILIGDLSDDLSESPSEYDFNHSDLMLYTTRYLIPGIHTI
jgi:hypothetical protein